MKKRVCVGSRCAAPRDECRCVESGLVEGQRVDGMIRVVKDRGSRVDSDSDRIKEGIHIDCK